MPIGSIIGIGSSIAGGIIGNNAAGAAAGAANQAAQQANSGLQGIENQSTANLQPFVNTGQQANSALAGLLGIGGDSEASRNAFQNYLGSTNYQFQLNQGLNGVEYANAPAFSSGATAKALNNYAQGQAGNALGGYEGQLSGLSGQGIGAAGTLGQLGNQNLGMQGQNLLAAAGVQGSADIYGANSTLGALRGVTSGLSSFGGGALGGLFGGGGGTSFPLSTDSSLGTGAPPNPNGYGSLLGYAG